MCRFLVTVLIPIAIVYTSVETQYFPEEVQLNYLFTGNYAKYFVSSEATDVITAEQTCKNRNKALKLLAIEEEAKFEEILPHLVKTIGVDGIWTSGIETTYGHSQALLWSSIAKPVEYSNFAPNLQDILLGRFRRSIHGVNPVCACDGECVERPFCQLVNCTVTGETCTVDQPTCTDPTNQDCYLAEPTPTCTVTCPECVLQRGKCTLTQPVCSVKLGTPNCTTSRSSHCTVIPAQYEVIPGKCSAIQEPCTVAPPSVPCDRPINCSCQYNPNCGLASKSSSSGAVVEESSFYAPRNCSLCPAHGPCSNPCPQDDQCYRIFDCIPDLICQPPPVVCPPPIHHCLTAQLVQSSEETLDCDEPETICDPPVVECTEVQKRCEEDVIKCPPPQTLCTPAVSHCPRPEYACTSPQIECDVPLIDCPALPDCQIPPSCYNNKGFHLNSGECSCRGKRETREKGELITAKCIVLKKSFGYKWTLEDCSTKHNFICEEQNL